MNPLIENNKNIATTERNRELREFFETGKVDVSTKNDLDNAKTYLDIMTNINENQDVKNTLAEFKKLLESPTKFLQDVVTFIPEVIRNLVHIGGIEIAYIVGFTIFIIAYRSFCDYLWKMRGMKMLAVDAGIFAPYVLITCVSISGIVSLASSLVFVALAMVIVLLPRILMVFMRYHMYPLCQKVYRAMPLSRYRDRKNRIVDSEFPLLQGGAVYYTVAIVSSICAALVLSTIFYSPSGYAISMDSTVAAANTAGSSSAVNMLVDVTRKRMYAALLLLGISRAIYLYAERRIAMKRVSEQNAFKAEIKVAKETESLISSNFYIYLFAGTLLFISVFYSVYQAVIDTNLAHDIYVAKRSFSYIINNKDAYMKMGLKTAFDSSDDTIFSMNPIWLGIKSLGRSVLDI